MKTVVAQTNLSVPVHTQLTFYLIKRRFAKRAFKSLSQVLSRENFTRYWCSQWRSLEVIALLALSGCSLMDIILILKVTFLLSIWFPTNTCRNVAYLLANEGKRIRTVRLLFLKAAAVYEKFQAISDEKKTQSSPIGPLHSLKPRTHSYIQRMSIFRRHFSIELNESRSWTFHKRLAILQKMFDWKSNTWRTTWNFPHRLSSSSNISRRDRSFFNSPQKSLIDLHRNVEYIRFFLAVKIFTSSQGNSLVCQEMSRHSPIVEHFLNAIVKRVWRFNDNVKLITRRMMRAAEESCLGR